MKTRIYAAPAVKGLKQLELSFCVVIRTCTCMDTIFEAAPKRSIYLNHCYWEWNVCLNIKFANTCSQIIKSNFNPFEVVGRGSQTQLQVGEKVNDLI